jgi:Zn-dependent protease
MPRYIRINNLKQTLAEDLRLAHSWKVFVLWIPKLFRMRLEFMSGIPIPLPFQEFVIGAECVPPEAAEKLAELLHAAAQLGFATPVYHLLRTLGGETVMTSANCRHSRGEIVARVVHMHLGNVHPAQQKVTLCLMTQLMDGRRLVTSDQRRSFNSPPNVIAQRRIGASLTELLTMHRRKLDELCLRTSPERVLDEEGLAAFCDRAELEALEFHRQRGLYEEISPEEVEQKQARLAAHQVVAGENETDNAVLTEIDRLQNRKGNWKTGFAVGLVTLIAFLIAGGVRWNWEFVLILTGVVTFHELGHFVAMRLLRYRDLRMFFVPLLGAAVTGRHYNVKGWQRAVVSLAGPVPGIVVGLALVGATQGTGNLTLELTALILLVVNGINLLPFVPLDGGWVMHAVLFSRHFVLETAFMAFAGASLLAATWLGWGRLWMWLGVLVLIGLPSSYRLARLAGRLRRSGFPATSPDEQTIPPEAAASILGELKQIQQRPCLPKHLASQTLSVFQKLNATPPGVLASAVLIAAYLGAGVGAIVGTRAVFAERAGRFLSGAEYWPRPKWVIEPSEIRVAGAAKTLEVDWSAPIWVAIYTNAIEANGVFASASRQLRPKQRLTLFGRTLFLVGSTNRPSCFEPGRAQFFVEKPASNLTAIVSLSCRAPNEASAAALIEKCEAALGYSDLKAWPPWTDLKAFPAERISAIERFRYTSQCVRRIDGIISHDPAYKRVSQSAGFSLRRRTNADLLAEMQRDEELRRGLYQQELTRLAQTEDARLDKDLLKLYANWWSASEDGREAALEALHKSESWRNGALPLTGELPDCAEAWKAALSGGAEQRNSRIQFRALTFYRTDLGLPALVAYLQQEACTDFEYELRGILQEDAGAQ